MSTFKEGRLEFDFSSAKAAERLDAQGTALPHGMALVDFVVEETSKLLLIEVKDPEGAPPAHRAQAVEDFLKKMSEDTLIHQELVPKARDSYTFLHLLEREKREIIFVAVVGAGSPDAALLGDFKNRLLARLRHEASVPWVREYVKDCIVITPQLWSAQFHSYALSGA